MMNCPQCGAWTELLTVSKVLETRTRQDGSKRRTYICGNEHKFTTVERVEEVTHGGARRKRDVMNQQVKDVIPNRRGAFVDGWISAERAHGITEE